MPEHEPLIVVEDLQSFYGESHILHGVSFSVEAGEVVTLLGRNGAGKTTLIKSVMGLVTKTGGSVAFTRDPSGRRRSAMGCAVSIRRLARAAIRSITQKAARLPIR